MRTLLVWSGVAAMSVLLGVILYSTSLQGSHAGYQETSPLVAESPSASPVVRGPESGMAREVPSPPAPQVVAPQVTQAPAAPAYTPPPATSSEDSEKERERDESEREREDD